jgi:cytochrome bd-type quinol oxidase subunit 1
MRKRQAASGPAHAGRDARVLAVLVSSAWFIAAIGAYYLLRRRALVFARKTLSISLAAAAVLLPIYGAWAMFSVAFIGVIMRLRRRLYTERWFLRLVLWMLPVGVIATIGGWRDVHGTRQPAAQRHCRGQPPPGPP